MELDREDDLVWAVDVLFQLKSQGVLQQNAGVSSGFMRTAAMRGQRDRWYKGPGAMPDEVIAGIMKEFGIGWWSINLRLYGYEEVNAASAKVVREAFALHTSKEFKIGTWRRGQPIEGSGAGIPSVLPMQLADWRGGRGAHLTFSPVMPPDGKLALAQFRQVFARFREHGFDYYGGYVLGDRHMIATSGVVWDRSDAGMVSGARKLFAALLGDAIAAGYSEYRTHLGFMDEVAQSFDFNDHALMRLNETVKNALDPNGVIAPGKQGVWPRGYKQFADKGGAA